MGPPASAGKSVPAATRGVSANAVGTRAVIAPGAGGAGGAGGVKKEVDELKVSLKSRVAS